MTIQPGAALPEASFMITTADGPQKVTTAEIFAGRKVVFFGVPGAFTPTCHMNHLPGYLAHLDELKAKGVDAVVVMAVNDPHVMKHWAEATGAAGKITFLADGNADFARATGLELDLSAVGMGMRCQRFSMIVEDGVVKVLNIETERGVKESGVEKMLTQL
jgi:glutaredoxin/glutathione-dependent peroxiredoxin